MKNNRMASSNQDITTLLRETHSLKLGTRPHTHNPSQVTHVIKKGKDTITAVDIVDGISRRSFVFVAAYNL